MMVADLAIFFEVSKQAMRIRLEELGIMVNTVPQPEKLRRIDCLTLLMPFPRIKIFGGCWCLVHIGMRMAIS